MASELDYVVARGADYDQLYISVQAFLDDDYELWGGVAIGVSTTVITYLQALTKKLNEIV